MIYVVCFCFIMYFYGDFRDFSDTYPLAIWTTNFLVIIIFFIMSIPKIRKDSSLFSTSIITAYLTYLALKSASQWLVEEDDFDYLSKRELKHWKTLFCLDMFFLFAPLFLYRVDINPRDNLPAAAQQTTKFYISKEMIVF